MRKISKIILLLFISLLIGCSFFFDKEKLGDNYYYLSIFDAYDVGFEKGPIIYKSNQKMVFEKIIIEGDVVEVNYNDNYIIAKKANHIEFRKEYFNDEKVEYFIISKKSDSIFGPYNEMWYKVKKMELNLDLKFIDN
jgi:hypothetical protein